MALTRDYREWFIKQLRQDQLDDPSHISGYLSACLDEGEDVFLLGLKTVAQATDGIEEPAERAELPRTKLDKILSVEGDPTFSNITAVLESLGMQFQCVPTQNGSCETPPASESSSTTDTRRRR